MTEPMDGLSTDYVLVATVTGHLRGYSDSVRFDLQVPWQDGWPRYVQFRWLVPDGQRYDGQDVEVEVWGRESDL